MPTTNIPFIVGEIYKRSDIHNRFGGQQQGGISTPAEHNLIFLFTGDTGEQYGYSDGWSEDSVFLYTGEGQVGDMTFTRGNLAIRDHLANDKTIHIFEYVRTGYVRYVDQMICTGYHYRQGPDRDGTTRQIIVFELAPIQLLNETTEAFEQTLAPVDQAVNIDLDSLRQKALTTASETSTPIERRTAYRKRSYWIKEYTLRRANGVCEGRNQPAPFFTIKGEPYLEVHHLDRLADGGPDHPECVVAICPNCHARTHYAEDGQAYNEYLRSVARQIEDKLGNIQR